ncbi:MAG TPA: tRNA (adenosine(37)-N6)-threonylcarbamoyltransferase complex transferase subunit TsaD [Candidatus Paceibacterota bacterium]|nr:tRNA (adenosine(37)-N6)-threonylcarbamoyltransferase complex transferase subunit TsaD [Candidatus Paceibacterota bacterium]
MNLRVLAIETSCDETGLAVVHVSGGLRAPKVRVVKSLVASQIKIHQPFGGVVPNLAKREHLKNLPVLYAKLTGGAKNEARFWKAIDLVTVTVGPGLEPALWTGIEFAKRIAREHGKPLVGANHLEGHLYSFLLGPAGRGGAARASLFPAVALIVSGGHTVLLRLESFSKWKRLGETRDDAAGEAYDKVARLLDLPYPGGPEIERLAKLGNDDAIAFPRPMINDRNFDFSFSGLKTSVLYYLRGQDGTVPTIRSAKAKADIAASFQKAALDVLVAKTVRAARDAGAKSVLLSGGVAANRALRTRLARESRRIGAPCLVPPPAYNLDNAAMIGVAGAMAHLRKKRYPLTADGGLDI